MLLRTDNALDILVGLPLLLEPLAKVVMFIVFSTLFLAEPLGRKIEW